MQVEQGVPDLPTCKDDIIEIMGSLARYGITDTGKNQMYKLDDTPSYKRVFKARVNMSKRFRAHPNETFLVIIAVAGHGMQMDGR